MRVGHKSYDNVLALEASLLLVSYGGKGVLVVLVSLDGSVYFLRGDCDTFILILSSNNEMAIEIYQVNLYN